jgi:hypothetical protein
MSQIDSHFQTLSEGQHHLLNVIEEEYREGMLLLNSIDKSVTVYGGSRIPVGSSDYEEIKQIGQFFGSNDWYVITGGGPGAMAAALSGSKEVGGKTAAFRITLENLEPQVVVPDIDYECTQFSTRKYLLRQADVFVVVPGGFGTLDELAELLNLIKTDKYPVKHVFLFKKQFWSGLVDWLQKTVFEERGLVTPESMKSFTVVDTVEELADHLVQNPYLNAYLENELDGSE